MCCTHLLAGMCVALLRSQRFASEPSARQVAAATPSRAGMSVVEIQGVALSYMAVRYLGRQGIALTEIVGPVAKQKINSWCQGDGESARPEEHQ